MGGNWNTDTHTHIHNSHTHKYVYNHMVNPDDVSGMFLFMTNDNYYHCDTVYGNLELFFH